MEKKLLYAPLNHITPASFEQVRLVVTLKNRSTCAGLHLLEKWPWRKKQ